jgi:signal transduction histidine kinase
LFCASTGKKVLSPLTGNPYLMARNIILLFAGVIILWSCNDRPGKVTGSNPRFDSVLALADRMGDSGNVSQALDLVQRSFKSIRPLSTDDKIHYLSYSNIYYSRRQIFDRCIEIADSMLAVIEADPDHPDAPGWKIAAYNNKADALFARGGYSNAYQYYNLAQVLANETKDSCSLRTFTYSIAMTLYRQQRFEQAAQRFKQSYGLASQCNEDFNIFYFKQEQLDNIGLCYSALKKYDSAMRYYQMALSYINANTGKFESKSANVYESPKAIVIGNMAEVYMHLGQTDSAIALYNHSIEINLQKGYTNSDARIDQTKLAELYMKLGDLKSAKATLDLIYAERDTIPDEKTEMKWHKLMWQYLEMTGDTVRGSRHLRAYTTAFEAYQNANRSLMETDLDMRVRNLEKQIRINKLVAGRSSQRTYMITVTAFAALVSVIVMLLLRNAYRSKKNLAELTELNTQVMETRERAEENLKKLQAKEKDNERILKSVAHDVMSPIAAVISLADILQNDKDMSREDQKEILDMIKESGTNSLKLSKDILEAAKEMKDTSDKRERTDVKNLVTREVEIQNAKAAAKKIKIVASVPENPIYAIVQEDKIRRVFDNLLSNAIKFSHEGSEINVRLTTQAGKVHVSIADNGIGIPERNKPHVFDMFTDAKAKGTNGEIPHGLGLSISQQIIRSHKGEIWFESEEGKGSTFHVTIPTDRA